jgi:hypothetical protein
LFPEKVILLSPAKCVARANASALAPVSEFRQFLKGLQSRLLEHCQSTALANHLIVCHETQVGAGFGAISRGRSIFTGRLYALLILPGRLSQFCFSSRKRLMEARRKYEEFDV